MLSIGATWMPGRASSAQRSHGSPCPSLGLETSTAGGRSAREWLELLVEDFEEARLEIEEITALSDDRVLIGYTQIGRGRGSGLLGELRRLGDPLGREGRDHEASGLLDQGRGPRSRRAVGVGDVGGELGDPPASPRGLERRESGRLAGRGLIPRPSGIPPLSKHWRAEGGPIEATTVLRKAWDEYRSETWGGLMNQIQEIRRSWRVGSDPRSPRREPAGQLASSPIRNSGSSSPFEDGKILRSEDFLSHAEALEAAGLTE